MSRQREGDDGDPGGKPWGIELPCPALHREGLCAGSQGLVLMWTAEKFFPIFPYLRHPKQALMPLLFC